MPRRAIAPVEGDGERGEGEGQCDFRWEVRETSLQRSGHEPCGYLGKKMMRKSKCKGPVVGLCLPYPRSNMESSVAGME